MHNSGFDKAAIDEINVSRGVPIVVRQVKYLNNHRAGSPRHQVGNWANARL
jgi:hypothetical protein